MLIISKSSEEQEIILGQLAPPFQTVKILLEVKKAKHKRPHSY